MERGLIVLAAMLLSTFLWSQSAIVLSSDSDIVVAEQKAVKAKHILDSANSEKKSLENVNVEIENVNSEWIVKLSSIEGNKEKLLFMMLKEFPDAIVVHDNKRVVVKRDDKANSSGESGKPEISSFERLSDGLSISSFKWFFLLIITLAVIVFTVRGYRQVSQIKKQQKNFKDKQKKLHEELNKGVDNV